MKNKKGELGKGNSRISTDDMIKSPEERENKKDKI